MVLPPGREFMVPTWLKPQESCSSCDMLLEIAIHRNILVLNERGETENVSELVQETYFRELSNEEERH